MASRAEGGSEGETDWLFYAGKWNKGWGDLWDGEASWTKNTASGLHLLGPFFFFFSHFFLTYIGCLKGKGSNSAADQCVYKWYHWSFCFMSNRRYRDTPWTTIVSESTLKTIYRCYLWLNCHMASAIQEYYQETGMMRGTVGMSKLRSRDSLTQVASVVPQLTIPDSSQAILASSTPLLRVPASSYYFKQGYPIFTSG